MDAKHGKLNTALFMAYCALMLWLLFDREGYLEGVPYREQLAGNLNLVPFRTVVLYLRLLKRQPGAYLIRHAIVNLLGNVVMFIPLGYFLPRLFRKLRKFWKTLLATALTITLVEIIQLFTLVGSCDIDDLILNVIGAAIGYGLFRLRTNIH